MNPFFRNCCFFFVAAWWSFYTQSAGLKIFSETETIVTVVFDNKKTKTFKIQDLSVPIVINAYLAGFDRIFWVGEHGQFYQVPLHIKGHKGWYILIIAEKQLLIKKYSDNNDAYTVINAEIVA